MKYIDIINKLKEEDLLINYEAVKNLKINYLSCNSKDVKKNTLFFCKGFNFKEEYLYEAISNGIVCYVSEVAYSNANVPIILVNDIRKAMAVISSFFFETKKYLFTIGVTGTKGKTTTVYFLHNVLNEWKKKKTAFISTIDYYTGKSSGLSHNTTPDSIELFRYINEAKKTNCKYLTMEVSSQAVKLDRIYKLMFDFGAFLNIGSDHISTFEHENFDDYLNCKISFLNQCKKVFIFKQTDKYDYIRKEIKTKEIVTFGFDSDCDYYLHDIKKDSVYTHFIVSHNNIDEEYKIQIHGKFNCVNATCVIAMVKELGIEYQYIYNGLAKTKIAGRMTIFENGVCPIIVDYAHNKLSIESLINDLKETYPNKNLKFVVGCPGNKAFNRRKEIGELMGKYSSFTYLTADDPQKESVFDICKEIVSYMPKKAKYEIIADREMAIIEALYATTKDDVMAIIGKGGETHQYINGESIYYDSDIKIVEEILKRQGEKNE